MDELERQAAYLEAHGLDKVLEALVVETMDQQPEDPYAFMSEQMFKLAESFAALTAAAAEGDADAAKEDGWWTKWNGPDVTLSVEEKVKLSASVAEEIIKDVDELRQVFKRKAHPVCYDGFEPSGRMHIAQGLQRAMNTNRLTQSGVKFVFWVADYFALMNLKMDGDMDKIQDCGKYMIEVWRACGMDLTNVEFVWASEFINEHADAYWFNVLQIALKNSITRIKRCCQIMGRDESDDLAAAQIFYPCMQCNDVFMLRCDLTQLGIDQRKVNMLAREYCDYEDTTGTLDYLGKDANGKTNKPVILSHHMLAALDGQDKMSKSNPDAAIFMEDTEAEVNRKIKKAFCPEKQLSVTEGDTVLKNGCMEYVQYLVLPKLGKFDVAFKAGGSKTYTNYDDVRDDFLSGAIHPSDLKPALAAAVNVMLEPVRQHFNNDPVAKDLLVKMEKYMAERAAKAAAAKKPKAKKGGGGGGGKGGKGGKAAAAAGPPPIFDVADPAVISMLDIRVGTIKNPRVHPSSEKLYVEDIDIAEDKPRQICSGLVPYIPVEGMSGLCCVVANLKSRKMAGVESNGMVLAAMSADGKTVELLRALSSLHATPRHPPFSFVFRLLVQAISYGREHASRCCCQCVAVAVRSVGFGQCWADKHRCAAAAPAACRPAGWRTNRRED
jgi:tyrosyl-tRNA synthetase